MDWQGQKLAEQLLHILVLAVAAAAVATGYALGSFQTMLLIYASGVVITTLIIVPDWPVFNRRPLKWLDSIEAEKDQKPLGQEMAAHSSRKKKKTSE